MSYQREFSKRINVGIIGAGSHCYRNIIPVMNFLPVRVKAVCDLNEELAKATARQYGCAYYRSTADMYANEKIDAVFICVGPKFHPRLTMEALDAGKHVWVEKPIATRASEVAEMIAHRGDRIVVAGLKKAFTPAAQKAIEIANSEKYGNIRSILAVYPMTIPEDGPEILKANGTPNWLLNGVHPLAFIMAVGGKVSAVTTLRNAAGNGAFVLWFKSGAVGNLHMSSGPQPSLERYGVYGDSWQLEIENTKITLQRGIPFDYANTVSYAPAGEDSGSIVWDTSNCLATLENKALFTQGFYSETMYFCNCVLENRKPEQGTLEFALEIMKVYEAGLLSQGRTIAIE